jgi:hypothetical protein
MKRIPIGTGVVEEGTGQVAVGCPLGIFDVQGVGVSKRCSQCRGSETTFTRISTAARNSNAVEEFFRLFIVIVGVTYKEASCEKLGQIERDLMQRRRISLQGFDASNGLV